jgi:MFS-type transporter involved in bile tolerance (Atg22 family)
MSQDGITPDKAQAPRALQMALLGVIGQVGCLTLVIILVAVVAGLWLDNQFQTRPLFTIIFIIVSMPITIYLMFRVVLAFAPRIQNLTDMTIGSSEEENVKVGEHREESSQT